MDVNWHKQTSAIITILSPNSFLIWVIAFWTIPLSSKDELPASSLLVGIPNNMIAGIPKSMIVLTSLFTSSNGNLSISDIDSTLILVLRSSWTNTGQMKSLGVNVVSWTNSLIFSDIRNLLRRLVGNDMFKINSG